MKNNLPYIYINLTKDSKKIIDDEDYFDKYGRVTLSDIVSNIQLIFEHPYSKEPTNKRLKEMLIKIDDTALSKVYREVFEIVKPRYKNKI
ncbi:MAG: hypothetical protein IJ399_00370 [Bacilli bacterium]|nr:hypothetical protein [Bacilli bacterium]